LGEGEPGARCPAHDDERNKSAKKGPRESWGIGKEDWGVGSVRLAQGCKRKKKNLQERKDRGQKVSGKTLTSPKKGVRRGTLSPPANRKGTEKKKR